MAEILVADIGGTTSRFAFVKPGQVPSGIVTAANDQFADAEAALAQALRRVAAKPTDAVLAVACPITGDEIALTNRNWRFSLRALSEKLGMRIHAINDFEALAWSLSILRETDARPIGEGARDPNGVRLVLGPGTGLGVAALVPIAGGFHVVPGEGGHSSFGPVAPDEAAIFARLAEEFAPLSAEHVISGPGLARLHRAVNPGVMKLAPEMILRQARAGDREARNTVALFVRLLGRFAGDMALAFKATGGIYLAGGVAAGLGPLLDARLFRGAFDNHPPQQPLLARIATALITREEPGLLGCSAYAAAKLALR
jgi:glucokinase